MFVFIVENMLKSVFIPFYMCLFCFYCFLLLRLIPRVVVFLLFHVACICHLFFVLSYCSWLFVFLFCFVYRGCFLVVVWLAFCLAVSHCFFFCNITWCFALFMDCFLFWFCVILRCPENSSGPASGDQCDVFGFEVSLPTTCVRIPLGGNKKTVKKKQNYTNNETKQ